MMSRKHTSIDRTGFSGARIALLSLVVATWGSPLVKGQEPIASQPFSAHEAATLRRNFKGQLVAEGNNRVAVGKLKVKTYRLEEMKLVDATAVSGVENRTASQSVFRLTVTGGPFPAVPYVIFVDDEALVNVSGNSDELSALIFDPRVLSDAATISVSPYSVFSYLSTIPEKLQLPARLQTSKRDYEAANIRLQRIPAEKSLRGIEEVEVFLTSPTEVFEVQDAMPLLQIGKEDLTIGSARGRTAVFRLTLEQFERAKNGGMVRVKFSPGPGAPGIRFGRLNKSLLEG